MTVIETAKDVKKRKKEPESRNENTFFLRVMLCLVSWGVYTLFVLAVSGMMVIGPSYLTIVAVFKICVPLMLAAAAVLAVIAFRSCAGGSKKRASLFLHLAYAPALIAVTLWIAAYHWSAAASKALFALGPALAVLYIVGMIYDREFAVIAYMTVLLGAAEWAFGRTGNIVSPLNITLIVLIYAALAAVVLILLKAKKNNGLLTGGRIRLFTAKTAYFPMFVACAVNAALFTAVLIFPAASVACVLISAGGLLTAAAYYTVRMI